MTETKRNWGYIIIGLFIILSSAAIFIWKEYFLTLLVELTAIIVVVYGLIQLIKIFLDKEYNTLSKHVLLHLIVGLTCGLLASWLLQNPGTPVRLLSYIIGFYQIVIGLINLVSYFLLKMDRITDRFWRIIYAFIHIGLGTTTINLSLNNPQILNLLGIYILFIGFTYVNDGRKVFISEEESTNLKRKMRFPIPIIFQALLPQNMLRKINKFIEEELDIDPETIKKHQRKLPATIDEDHLLQVQVSTSPNNIDIIGHTSFSYKNKIYSYGNHDVDSRRFSKVIGDGVLAICDKQSYLNFAMERGVTNIEYDIVLNEQQVKQLKTKLNEIHSNIYEWNPTSKAQLESYGGQLVKETNTHLYKFLSSRFKTYFALGTNCVLLTDEIIGISGLDLFIMVGVLSPGTYYDYFEKEYKKQGSIIINRRIYNKELFQYLNLPKLSSKEVLKT